MKVSASAVDFIDTVKPRERPASAEGMYSLMATSRCSEWSNAL